jgi:hypothetical protein
MKAKALTEDQILALLNASKGDLLNDDKLIKTLQKSKAET